jgi:hypothetical protein
VSAAAAPAHANAMDPNLPWYGGVALVLSNLFLVPAIVFAILHWEAEHDDEDRVVRYTFRPRIVDAVVFGRIFAGSVMYHMCHAGWGCVSPFAFMQAADHVQVWMGMVWITLLFLSFQKEITFSAFLLIELLFQSLPFVLMNTSLFPVAFLPAVVVLLFMRVTFMHIPILKYDILLGVVAVLLFVSGVFFINGADVYDPQYWYIHATWHVLAMTALTLLYLDLLGFSFTRVVGIHAVTVTLHEYEAQIRSAARQKTKEYKHKLKAGW